MNKAEKEVVKLLKKNIKSKDISLEVPPNPDMGDFAFPCFSLSKELKKNPAEIAKDLAEKMKAEGTVRSIKATGPYVNFFIDKQELAKDIIGEILQKKDNYGSDESKDKRIMIEFMSPNTNKSLHLGHVRNGILGEVLTNVLRFKGYDVIKTCLNNDRGTGVTEAMLGYKKFFSDKTPKGKPDSFVSECYVAMKKALKEDPKISKEVQEMLLKWEQEDKDVIDLWDKIMKWVYEGYKETYKRLGISFDKEYYESEIYKEGKDIVIDGLEKGIFIKEDGAVIAKLEDHKLPNKVLIKSDGTSLYMTQDIYLARLKYAEFDIDKSIYVVGSEQDNHFRQLFKILEILKFKHAEDCYHLSYGMVNLPSGKMKSREGTVVDADGLMEDTVDLAKEEIKKRYPDLAEDEVVSRAESIGLGAIKFLMIKYDNATDFVFDPKKAISFEGETGPYVQYAHARICSIFEKYGKKLSGIANFNVLSDKEDERLLMLLMRFPEIVSEAAENYKPYLVARYVLELAQAFNEFYHACPILQADEDVKKARLFLISGVKQVLKNGLSILGIDAPEKM